MRRALVLAMAATLVMVGCSDSSDDSAGDAETEGVEAAATWTPTPGMPFVQPDDVFQGKDVSVTLDMARRTIAVSGSNLEATPYLGTPSGGQPLTPGINGPTIHVSPGGTITVNFVNDLDQNTNIHYHGLHVSPLGESDNVFRTFAPGSKPTSVVKLPDNHPAGTYWYHVHFHGDSEIQVNGGLSGLLIVDGVEKSLPPALQDIEQRFFALREVMTIGDKVVNQAQRKAGGYTTTRLVNGLLEPILSIDQSEYQLWRFANIGPDIFYYLRLEDHLFYIVAEDGNPVFDGKITARDVLEMPPGKRYDVVVIGGQPRSNPYALTTTAKTGPISSTNPAITMANVTVVPSNALAEMLPADISIDAPEDGLREDRTQVPEANLEALPPVFTFGFANGHFAINNEQFNPDKLNWSVKLGAYETWILRNTTGGPHPFHIHVNEFQVVSINGEPYDAIGVQDIVAIPPMHKDANGNDVPGEVVIINHFLDYDGWFVFHCHILNHEDDGMMQTIEVLREGQIPMPPPHSNGVSHPRITVG